MTPIQLCKAIARSIQFLPNDVRHNIVNRYQKTYTLVILYEQGLAKPTPAALAYLTDLWNVVDREREKRVMETGRFSD